MRKNQVVMLVLGLVLCCGLNPRPALAQTPNFWTLPISVQIDNNRFDLYLGVRPSATAGFDASLDTIAPPPPFTPYAVLAIPVFPNTLQADYRGVADSIVWSLRILNTNGASSQVTWNTSRLRASGNGRLVLNDTLNMLAKNATTFAGDQTVRIKSVGVIVSVKSSSNNTAPKLFSLASYPNPFATTTNLEISLPVAPGPVAVRIFNLLGEEIRAFNHAPNAPGILRFQWDGRDAQGALVPSGIYFCRLETRGGSIMRKLYRLR